MTADGAQKNEVSRRSCLPAILLKLKHEGRTAYHSTLNDGTLKH
jgi:hypothetical protein